VEKPAPPGPPFDWSRLFQAAGLDVTAFQPTDPTWAPPASCDARAAWTGTDRATGAKLRVEAAAWRGRPVFFRIIGPWTVPERSASSSGSQNQIPIMVIVYVALITACGIAWVNYRAGRTDPRGALRLFQIYFISMSAAALMTLHHTATRSELSLFWLAVSSALINAALNWIFYTALEPWVRRKWPQTMISWSRYVSKGFRDPLVGRDLLYGAALGLGLNLVSLLGAVLHGNSGQPVFPPLDLLSGARWVVAGVIDSVPSAVFNALLMFFLLFLLRVLLRKEWIAAAVFVVLMAAAVQYGTTTPAIDYPLALAALGILAIALLRLGLLAAIVASIVGQLASLGGILDFSAWYAGLASIPFVVIAVIAAMGYAVGVRRAVSQP